MKYLFWWIEDLIWGLRCSYNLWLHGGYGLAKVMEKIPFRYLVKYLQKYGAKIGENCRFERGINIHRPLRKNPFENLIIGDNVYLGHNSLIDLTRKVFINDNVIIASRCQIWTHASYYGNSTIGNPDYGEKYGDVIIKRGALIYSNTIVTHGSVIGEYSKIGASSLVNKNIPDNRFLRIYC